MKIFPSIALTRSWRIILLQYCFQPRTGSSRQSGCRVKWWESDFPHYCPFAKTEIFWTFIQWMQQSARIWISSTILCYRKRKIPFIPHCWKRNFHFYGRFSDIQTNSPSWNPLQFRWTTILIEISRTTCTCSHMSMCIRKWRFSTKKQHWVYYKGNWICNHKCLYGYRG